MGSDCLGAPEEQLVQARVGPGLLTGLVEADDEDLQLLVRPDEQHLDGHYRKD